jgi:hypothetical protein
MPNVARVISGELLELGKRAAALISDSGLTVVDDPFDPQQIVRCDQLAIPADTLMLVEDLDNDGSVEELILPTFGGQALRLREDCASFELGNFTPREGVRRMWIADLDGDRVLDLVSEAAEIVVHPGDRYAGRFGAELTVPRAEDRAHYSAAAFKADADPELELAVLTDEGVVRFDLARGERGPAVFLRSVSYAETSGFPFGTIESADLNHDGLPDLAFTDRAQIHTRLLRGHNRDKEAGP